MRSDRMRSDRIKSDEKNRDLIRWKVDLHKQRYCSKDTTNMVRMIKLGMVWIYCCYIDNDPPSKEELRSNMRSLSAMDQKIV